jgi:transglutaminase-like putative cysteine protease
MCFTLFVLSVVWVHLHAPDSKLNIRLKIAAVLILQAIPLTLILFILFPRIQGPLWGLPQDAFASSGLDESMSPGSLGHLAMSDAVAFRVAYTGAAPRRNQMYWRGPVLWNFDGRTWTAGTHLHDKTPEVIQTSQAIEYNVTLEPHNKNWIFALDMPEKISLPVRYTDDFQALSMEPVNTQLRYQARSQLSYLANPHESAIQLKRALQLPENTNPQTLRFAASLRGSKDSEIIRRVLAYFNQQNFYYTLSPPPLGINAIDDFLFNTRRGFCEHYASSFVYLMRAANIPARVVTGYQGGEYNDLGDYYIIRQSDAHAWAEVWLEGTGWQRVDPTAAIAPARVEHGMSAALNDNTALSIFTRTPPLWLRELRLNWDAASYLWKQWIIGYDNERQFAFLTRLGLESTGWQQMALNMLAGLSTLIALLALLMLRHLFKHQHDKTQTAWLRLCRKLGKAGLPRADCEGPSDYAARIAAARPDLADSMHDLATRYLKLRYAPAQDIQAQHDFIHLSAKFCSSRKV